MAHIDLNADLGEGEPCDTELLGIVTSCNIACGGHAGDAKSMRETVLGALSRQVSIGAHPSYPDKQGFGRRSRFMAGDELLSSLRQQIGMLREIASQCGAELRHVKPHGALYNDAARDADLAAIVAGATLQASPGAALVGLPNSELETAAKRHSLTYVAEGFIDRAYQPDGQLKPRSEPGAVLGDLEHIVEQALSLVGSVDTLCIHGDTSGAVKAASAVREALQNNGVELRAIGW